MSITVNDLRMRIPTEDSNNPTNGGRMTFTEAVGGVQNNVFPNVPESERESGSTVYRKRFLQVNDNQNLELVDPKLFLETHTPGDDAVYKFLGTQRDTQNDLTGSEDYFGAGTLNTTVSSGATDIEVEVEDATQTIFRVGERVRISEKASVTATGNQEYKTISNVSAPVGNVFTLTLSTPLVNGYTASVSTPVKIASMIEPGNILTSFSNFIVTSTAGTYDIGTYPLILFNQGTIEQDLVFTFTSATQFDCVGDTLGALGTGNIGAAFSPQNPVTGKNLFTLQFQGFGGTFDVNDTISCTISPASIPIWYVRIIPAGASQLAGNNFITGLTAESS